MSNADRFLDAFNQIDRVLRKVTNNNRGEPFNALVEKVSRTNPIVRQFQDDLRQFARLRNAIVHETRNGQVIAEPAEWVVARIEHIASMLVDAPKVFPSFAKKVLTLDTEDSIKKAIQCMSQYSFSQIPIYSGSDFAGLLTTNTIVRWLGAYSLPGKFDLFDTRIGEVLEHTEDVDAYCFLRESATVFEVLEKFRNYQTKGKRLEAILITERGKPSEKLLGIITVWDLPKVHEFVEGHAL